MQVPELAGKGTRVTGAFKVGAKVNQAAVVNQGGGGNSTSTKYEGAATVLQTIAMQYPVFDTDFHYFLKKCCNSLRPDNLVARVH